MANTKLEFYSYDVAQIGERKGYRVNVIAENEQVAEIAAGRDEETMVTLYKQSGFEKRVSVMLAKKSMSPQDKLLLFHNLSSFMKVGANPADALTLAAPLMQTPYSRGLVAGMAQHMLRDGDDISTSASHYPDFAEMDIAIMEAGEQSGHIVDSLASIAQEYRDAGELKSKVRKAATYPVVMLFIIGIAFFVITAFVLPKLLAGVLGLGGDIPFITKVLLVLSGIFSTYWYLVIAGLVLTVACAFSFWPVLSKAAWFQSFTIRLPVIGKLLRAIVLSRTLSTLALMAKSGIRFTDAFEMARRVSGHHEYERFYREVSRRYSMGEPLHIAFGHERARIGKDGQIISSQLKVGHISGKPADVMESIAEERKKMLSDYADVLPTALNPIMTAVITTLGVTIVVGVFAPLITVFANMGN